MVVKSIASSPVEGFWNLYIIETDGGRLYTGITTDVERRFKQHIEGRGAKFFRTDAPKKIRYQAQFVDRSAASREEFRIKKLARIKKLELIEKSAITLSL